MYHSKYYDFLRQNGHRGIIDNHNSLSKEFTKLTGIGVNLGYCQRCNTYTIEKKISSRGTSYKCISCKKKG